VICCQNEFHETFKGRKYIPEVGVVEVEGKRGPKVVWSIVIELEVGLAEMMFAWHQRGLM